MTISLDEFASIVETIKDFLRDKETQQEIKLTLRALNERTGRIMSQVEDVKAALDRTNANLDNIAADENSLLQKIAELQAQVAAGSAATPEQMQELLDQASALVLRTRALADAVPDAPAPTPE